MVTIDGEKTLRSAMSLFLRSGFSRIPVVGDGSDDILGLLYFKDVVRRVNADQESGSLPVTAQMRPMHYVPESKPVDDLLREMQRDQSHFAVVVDEYGGTAGLVTIEDIIEEIVGEIADETDPAAGAVRRLANGDLYVRGHVPLNDLADYGMELPVDSDAYNSVGGLVFGELGRLPKRGDMVRVNGYSLRVESVRENRIEAVRIRDHTKEGEGEAAGEEREGDSGGDDDGNPSA
jgi:CBS domain containing-hemolysin-like protein